MIRYRDGKIVSTKGERFTQVSKAESEEMKKSIVGSSSGSSSSLCYWRLALAGGGPKDTMPPVNATIGYDLPGGCHHGPRAQAISEVAPLQYSARLTDNAINCSVTSVDVLGSTSGTIPILSNPFSTRATNSRNQKEGLEPRLESWGPDCTTCLCIHILSVMKSLICSVPSTFVHGLEVGSCNSAFSTTTPLQFQCTLPSIR